jgi:hypothetical protein
VGVRVKVRVKYGGASLDLAALVNTGYETDVPELLVPVGGRGEAQALAQAARGGRRGDVQDRVGADEGV